MGYTRLPIEHRIALGELSIEMCMFSQGDYPAFQAAFNGPVDTTAARQTSLMADRARATAHSASSSVTTATVVTQSTQDGPSEKHVKTAAHAVPIPLPSSADCPVFKRPDRSGGYPG